MKKILVILGVLLLAGCEQAPPAFVPDPIDFSGKPTIRVDVAEVRFVESYKAPLREPNVEHLFPTPPAVAVKQWLKQRVFAVGTSGVLEITVNDASVKEVKLPKTQGIQGLFTDDQDTRYDANLSVSLRLFNGTDSMSVASGDVIISRSRSINEKATVNDRERLFDAMTKEMMMTFDQQATERLRQYFASYLK